MQFFVTYAEKGISFCNVDAFQKYGLNQCEMNKEFNQ
jgi:hypothetical protein